MKKIFNLLSLTKLVAGSLTSSFAHADAKQDLINNLNSLQTMSASFVQIVVDMNAKQIATSSGNIKIMKPGYLLLKTTSPQATTLAVQDSLAISFYDPFVEQLTIYPTNSLSKLPLSYLIVETNTSLQGVSVTSQGNCFMLDSKELKNNFDGAEICFKNKQLISVAIIEKNHNKNQYSFSNIESNNKLTPADFKINIPKDTNILRTQ